MKKMNTRFTGQTTGSSRQTLFSWITPELILTLVLIVLIVLAAIGLYRLFHNIWLKRVEKEVREKSKRLASLKEINEEFGSKYIKLKPDENYYIKRNSKSAFDHYDPRSMLIDVVAENPEYYLKWVAEAKKNRIILNNYLKAIDEIEPSEFTKKSRIDVEEKIFEKEKLDRPVTNPAVKVHWSYVSPKGRNEYGECKSFYEADFNQAIIDIASRSTRKATIARERALMSDSLRYDIFKRDGFRCQICGSTAADGVKLHVDHIVPVSKGGKTEPSNLRTLCDRCNFGKGAKLEE